MALVRWSPFSELADMRREMQSLAGLMTSRFIPFMGEDRFIPAMDVTTRGEDLMIKLEIPAVDIEKDIDISVDEGMLRISGKRSEQRSEEKEGQYMREMRYGSFERTFPLPEGVDADAVKAEYRDGILEVTVTGGAKQMARPEAQHIRITRGPGSQAQGQSGTAPESWAPADTGSASSTGTSGSQGQAGATQMTPD
jgi:HSP20 family protein